MGRYAKHFPWILQSSRLVIASAALLLAWVTAAHSAEFSYDFSQGLAGSPDLRLIGPNHQQTARFDATGLQLTLPAKRPNRNSVGVVTAFRVRGDFEITTTFEILKAEAPPKGHYGSGARLFVKLDTPTKNVISIGRVIKPKERDLFVAHHVSVNKKGKEVQQMQGLPASSKTGKLRLSRTGPTVFFSVLDGNKDDFQEFYQVNAGTQDLEQVQLTATTGGEPAAVDLRFVDVAIRADKFAVGPPVSEKVWLFWWLSCAAAVIIVVGTGVRYWLRARSGHRDAGPPDLPAPARRDAAAGKAAKP